MRAPPPTHLHPSTPSFHPFASLFLYRSTPIFIHHEHSASTAPSFFLQGRPGVRGTSRCHYKCRITRGRRPTETSTNQKSTHVLPAATTSCGYRWRLRIQYWNAHVRSTFTCLLRQYSSRGNVPHVYSGTPHRWTLYESQQQPSDALHTLTHRGGVTLSQ